MRANSSSSSFCASASFACSHENGNSSSGLPALLPNALNIIQACILIICQPERSRRLKPARKLRISHHSISSKNTARSTPPSPTTISYSSRALRRFFLSPRLPQPHRATCKTLPDTQQRPTATSRCPLRSSHRPILQNREG